MTGSTIEVQTADLAKITAQLVREGVIFKATKKVGCDDLYVIEFTGGF
jgi:hypothetical protein